MAGLRRAMLPENTFLHRRMRSGFLRCTSQTSAFGGLHLSANMQILLMVTSKVG